MNHLPNEKYLVIAEEPKMPSPLVSIFCATYNHAPYIRQCLDGFVLQKTNFPIEAIIHDDASTDGTADIIREYEQKYPEIIKPIYQVENQYSQKVNIGVKFIFPRVQGKYLALCEGDDYWTDEYKLQKQVDFLEANEDFSICFHPVKVYKEEDRIFIKNYLVFDEPDVIDIKTLSKGYYIYTASVMYRNNRQVFDEINNFPRLVIGDILLQLLFAKYGKIFRLPHEMAVYRIHKSGIWSTRSISDTHPNLLELYEALLAHFANDKDVFENLKCRYEASAITLLEFYIKNKDVDSQKKLILQVDNQFDGTSILLFNKIIVDLNYKIHSIKSSKSYRFGRILLTPFRALKCFWRNLIKGTSKNS